MNGYFYDLIAFSEIARHWDEIHGLEGEDEVSSGEVSKEVKVANYANEKWIPFAESRDGDYLLFDADPSPSGKFGQILELQNDAWTRIVVSPSLSELVQREIDSK